MPSIHIYIYVYVCTHIYIYTYISTYVCAACAASNTRSYIRGLLIFRLLLLLLLLPLCSSHEPVDVMVLRWRAQPYLRDLDGPPFFILHLREFQDLLTRHAHIALRPDNSPNVILALNLQAIFCPAVPNANAGTRPHGDDLAYLWRHLDSSAQPRTEPEQLRNARVHARVHVCVYQIRACYDLQTSVFTSISTFWHVQARASYFVISSWCKQE